MFLKISKLSQKLFGLREHFYLQVYHCYHFIFVSLCHQIDMPDNVLAQAGKITVD